MFEDVKKFVDESFQGKHVKHFDRTVHWVEILRPDADEALLIAAYGHDIERGHRKPEHQNIYHQSEKGFRDENMLRLHQDEGARIMGEFLAEKNADDKLIERVKHLITYHEEGGDEDQNLLKDCDSISFFETNAAHFVTEKAPKIGKEKVKDKFEYMFERITSDKAKKLAEPFYKKALQDLEAL